MPHLVRKGSLPPGPMQEESGRAADKRDSSIHLETGETGFSFGVSVHIRLAVFELANKEKLAS